jgi:hypothetical protein
MATLGGMSNSVSLPTLVSVPQVQYAEVRLQLDAADGLDRLPQLAALSVADFSQLFKKKPKRDALGKKRDKLEAQLVSRWVSAADEKAKAAVAATRVWAEGINRQRGDGGLAAQPPGAGVGPDPGSELQSAINAVREALKAITHACSGEQHQGGNAPLAVGQAVDQAPVGGRLTKEQRRTAQVKGLVSDAMTAVADVSSRMDEVTRLADALGDADSRVQQLLEEAAEAACQGASFVEQAGKVPASALAKLRSWEIGTLTSEDWYKNGMLKLVDNNLFE